MKEELNQLFKVIDSLRTKYKNHEKKFTLDGKLVGDIGEVLAAEYYGLNLYKDNKQTHDGYVIGNDTKEVQIKSSFNEYFYFTKNLNKIPKYFIAIQLKEDGTFEEIYNGTGELIFKTLLYHLPLERKFPTRLSVKKLRELNATKENTDKIKPRK